MRSRLTNRRALLLLCAALAVAGGATVAAILTFGAQAGSRESLIPANLSALTSKATQLPDVPAAARVASEEAPQPGQVHRLGHGRLAWISNGRICTYADQTGGCVDNWPHAVDATIGDVDDVGSGAPARVLGMATDDVVSVTVTLRDGRTVTVQPDANSYFAALPADAKPWDVTEVAATLKDGSVERQTLDLHGP
jgi:hypothetical protein